MYAHDVSGEEKVSNDVLRELQKDIRETIFSGFAAKIKEGQKSGSLPLDHKSMTLKSRVLFK
jgi:hypothetical protein